MSRAVSLRGLLTPSALHDVGKVRTHFVALTGLAATTIVAGALVAEIDGGREFQTFPKMGDRWIPHGLFEQQVVQVCVPMMWTMMYYGVYHTLWLINVCGSRYL